MIEATSEERRQEYAQHLTPLPTARLAASLFSPSDKEITALDLGAGTGMLSVALLERYGESIVKLDAIEQDGLLADVFEREVRPHIAGTTWERDAIPAPTQGTYDRIILNPPYKKMAADDPRQTTLPVKSPNLYTAFLIRAVEALDKSGEVVAIIPRSWMNGEYFLPFRKWLLGCCSLDAIHVYDSRIDVFADTSVLQEIMLVKLSNREQQPTIRVSQSNSVGRNMRTAEYEAESIIGADDLVISIAPDTMGSTTFEQVGLCASTGKVVDFRSRDSITEERPEGDAVRLIYAGNFTRGRLVHPADIGKGQWFAIDSEKNEKMVLPAGCYVAVKRFSAKEEKRRVVAYPICSDEPFALENHMNFIHQGTPRKVVPLASRELAYGIAAWLNSTAVDKWFRGRSGSTQVNASDIKKMPFPQLDELERGGEIKPREPF